MSIFALLPGTVTGAQKAWPSTVRAFRKGVKNGGMDNDSAKEADFQRER